jgi:hypothetical protein
VEESYYVVGNLISSSLNKESFLDLAFIGSYFLFNFFDDALFDERTRFSYVLIGLDEIFLT